MQTKLLRIGVVQMDSHFLEVEGEDFYNTFALASPDGSVAGKVRKSPPASLEAFFYSNRDNKYRSTR